MRALPSALVLLALLAPLALAQVPAAAPQVGVTLSAPSVKLGAGNQTVVFANVTNGGSLAGSVSLSLAAPERWDLRPEPRTFPLAAGATQAVQIVLVAPDAGQGAAQGSVEVKATFTEQGTSRVASGVASLAVTRVDPPAPAPPNPWPADRVALAVAGSLLVIAAVVAAETRRRRLLRAQQEAAEAAWRDRETGITLEAEGPLLPWGLRRELLQRVAVRNASDRPRVALVGVRRASPGWTAAISLPRLALGPGERAVITLYLNPAPDVPGGAEGVVVLFARAAEAEEHEETLRLVLAAPPVRVPVAGPPGSRPEPPMDPRA